MYVKIGGDIGDGHYGIVWRSLSRNRAPQRTQGMGLERDPRILLWTTRSGEALSVPRNRCMHRRSEKPISRRIKLATRLKGSKQGSVNSSRRGTLRSRTSFATCAANRWPSVATAGVCSRASESSSKPAPSPVNLVGLVSSVCERQLPLPNYEKDPCSRDAWRSFPPGPCR